MKESIKLAVFLLLKVSVHLIIQPSEFIMKNNLLFLYLYISNRPDKKSVLTPRETNKAARSVETYAVQFDAVVTL